MTTATMDFPLINIDTALSTLSEREITAEVIDAYVCAHAYKNFDGVEKRLPFVMELCTHSHATWQKLIAAAPHRYWDHQRRHGVLVFDASVECGFTRTYRYRPTSGGRHELGDESRWTSLRDEDALYDVLNTVGAKAIFDAWIKHKDSVTELPTEFVTGRLNNTSVEKAVIFSKGDGCVVCGMKATCYAATTTGTSAAALLVQLPVCQEHLATARAYPTIFQFLVSLFQLQVDWTEVQKWDAIPDNLVPIVHQLVASELGAQVSSRPEKRDRGWHLVMTLPSGWYWLLRLNSFTDYAYMLFEPNRKPERYRADSAKDHPELKFFPDHEHSRPEHKKDKASPSFLYGHPLFDLKRLKAVGVKFGAYPPDDVDGDGDGDGDGEK